MRWIMRWSMCNDLRCTNFIGLHSSKGWLTQLWLQYQELLLGPARTCLSRFIGCIQLSHICQIKVISCNLWYWCFPSNQNSKLLPFLLSVVANPAVLEQIKWCNSWGSDSYRNYVFQTRRHTNCVTLTKFSLKQFQVLLSQWFSNAALCHWTQW